MNKVDISELKSQVLCILSDNSDRTIFQLKNGKICKIFSFEYLLRQNKRGIDIESQILSATKTIPEIIVPETAIYMKEESHGIEIFRGSIMESAKGMELEQYRNELSQYRKIDLCEIASLYSNIESAVMRAQNIVFPDLCTKGNIFVDSQKNITLIDYEGMQVGDFPPNVISSLLGDYRQYFIPKYFSNNQYTKELDKKSLSILYFLMTFDININYISNYKSDSGINISIYEFLHILGFEENDEICNKIFKLFDNNQNNEYLSDSVYEIADKYYIDFNYSDKLNFIHKKLYKKL